MILYQILSDEQERDEACLAQSILTVTPRVEDLGLGTLTLILRFANQTAKVTSDPRQGAHQ